MASTLPLFPQRDWFKPNKPVEPTFWIREMRLLYRLEAGVDAEIRRVQLHRGLNIVWAKPADPNESAPALRGKGHDVGKTSFCRLIRHLLGEEHYGNEQLRRGIAAREALQHAWVAGEIVLDRESWTVACPLYGGARPFALKGVAIDESFAKPASERIRHEDFVGIFEQRVLQSFAVRTFDEGGTRAIKWLHLLQWLARDQESHLAGLFKWRDPSSQHDSPVLFADEAQFLVRCVLDLTDVKERKVIEKRNQLGRDKATAIENEKYYQRRISEALERARKELPGGEDLPSVGEPLFVDVVTQHAQKLGQSKRYNLEASLGELRIEEAEQALEKAIGARALAESRYTELKQLVDESADSLARFTDKKTETTKEDLDDLDAVIAKLKPDRSYCEIPVSIALFQCPLLQQKRLSTEEKPPQPLTVTELAQSRRVEIETQLKGLNRNLKQLASTLDNQQRLERDLRKARDAIRQRHSDLTSELTKLDPDVAAWRLRAEDAELSHTRLEETRKELVQIEHDLEESKASQDEAQRETRDRQIDIEEIFSALCRYFKGDDEGELKFTRDEIRARIGSGGGAYNALSSITFDFAALVAQIHGIAHHPGFLIHDSPRESDMEESLYYPIFKLIRELANSAPESFQYLITTTAAPPEEFMKSDHLILELDGGSPEGHLFKENF